MDGEVVFQVPYNVLYSQKIVGDDYESITNRHSTKPHLPVPQAFGPGTASAGL